MTFKLKDVYTRRLRNAAPGADQMNIGRFILRWLAYLPIRRAWIQACAFLDTHSQTRDVQDRLLKYLISRSEQTAFGRDHNFAGINSYEDFTARVPVRSYGQLQPYVDRVLNGETTALIPPGDPIVMFALTSGTTNQPKYIPVTGEFLKHMRRGFNVYGILALADHHDAWVRPILQITSPMCEFLSPTGVPCGAISGLQAATQLRTVRWMYPVPPEVASISDHVAKYYTIMRCGIGRNVAFIITGNPSSPIKLVETAQAHAESMIRDIADGTITPPGEVAQEIRRRLRFRPNRKLAAKLEAGLKQDGQLLPRHFWRLSFLANWTGGTLKLYLKRLRELFGDVPVRDIGLLASEGRFSIPITDNTAAGIAEITSNFLEFIPAEERESPDPPVLRAHEVEVGREYFLIATNFNGLWRYDIDDRVRVVAKYGQSPVFEFMSRGAHTANITGEKITEHQVVEAMHRTAAKMAIDVNRFLLQPTFAATPYYQIQLEGPDSRDIGQVAQAMDEALIELNMEYKAKRTSGRLGPIRAVVLQPGTFQQAELAKIQSDPGRSEQYKHRYLATDVIEEV